jgi:hypothetical protein
LLRFETNKKPFNLAGIDGYFVLRKDGKHWLWCVVPPWDNLIFDVYFLILHLIESVFRSSKMSSSKSLTRASSISRLFLWSFLCWREGRNEANLWDE